MKATLSVQPEHVRVSSARTAALRCAALLLPVLASVPFLGGGVDDTWIMLFAGETLGSGPWFLNQNGLAQEISTSVVGAVLAKIAAMIAPHGEAYGCWKVAAWLPACAAAFAVFELLRGQLGPTRALWWLIALICIPQWHFWAWGGVESGLFWLAVIGYAVALARFFVAPSGQNCAALAATASLMPLVRADALWAPLLPGLLAYLLRKRTAAVGLAPVLIAVGVTGAFHVTRHHMTGVWFPNPAYAKASWSVETVGWGVEYLAAFHAQSPLHALMALSLPLSCWGGYTLLTRPVPNSLPVSLFRWCSVVVLTIDLTTVLVGGDWMPHHRFAIRSLPLKVIVVALWSSGAWSAGWLQRSVRARSPAWSALLLAIAATGWMASGKVHQPYAGRVGVPSLPHADLLPWGGLTDYMVRRNRAALRDVIGIRPWIKEQLPALVQRARSAGRLPVTVASYQAGYFPREVRQHFGADAVQFIDLVGLSDHRISRLPGARSPHGLAEGAYGWAEALALGRGALGEFLAGCRPDAVYVLGVTPRQHDLMRRAQYRLAYAREADIDGTRMVAAMVFESERQDASPCNWPSPPQ